VFHVDSGFTEMHYKIENEGTVDFKLIDMSSGLWLIGIIWQSDFMKKLKRMKYWKLKAAFLFLLKKTLMSPKTGDLPTRIFALVW